MSAEINELLAELTDAQREAVQHVDGPLLVLAGPGSGKTRVITRRVAYLIECGIPAWSILAVTFTNKAAREMRERIDRLVPADAPGRGGLTVATFHSLCARLLRRYAAHAGLSDAYSIYDTADQREAVKQAINQANLDTKNWSPASVLSHISNAKNQLLTAEEFAGMAGDFFGRSIAKIYTQYEAILTQNRALDFDDLLLKMARLLRDNETVRRELQKRYQYLLIDEYQDTNHAQFVIAHTLAAQHQNICVVGDPDQSIYAWRGADIRNILEFESQFPEAKVIALGQNFRSTKHIVATADRLIRENKQRKHKDLYTELDEGEKPRVIRCRDERHEAELVVDELRRHDDADIAWKDMAVFYRVNALSRVMEEVLRHANIPYAIARGTAFYDRQEIRDALGYLRVIANPNDEAALRRIINTPTRGIGKTSLSRVEVFAYDQNLSMFEALRRVERIQGVSGKAQKSIIEFVRMVDAWRGVLDPEKSDGMFAGQTVFSNLADLVERVIRESGLESMYASARTAEDRERVENLEELVSSAADFQWPDELPEDAGPLAVLSAYLESIALVSDADMVDPERGAVTLMTLHAAKGLEFPVVCMIGLEEGLLPHSNASNDGDAGIEEERRLCYVGITRAMRHLQITSAATRTHRGMRERTIPSQFLRELPDEHIDRLDMAADPFGRGGAEGEGGDGHDEAVDDPHFDPYLDDHASAGFRAGQMVRHPQFGVGRIEWMSRERRVTRARVSFLNVGTKTLILEYARLEPVEP